MWNDNRLFKDGKCNHREDNRVVRGEERMIYHSQESPRVEKLDEMPN